MKRMLAGAGLAAALGLFAPPARAQDVEWTSVGGTPAAAAPAAADGPWRTVRGQAPAESETIAAPKGDGVSRLPDLGEKPAAPPTAPCPTFAEPVKIHFQGSPGVKIERDWLLDMPGGPWMSALADRVWLRAEYLLWTTKTDQLPPLATTSAPADMGFLGRPTTRILFGNQGQPNEAQSGFRISGGVWLDDCKTCGIDFNYFTLGRAGFNQDFGSDQFPVLSRPFFALNFNQEFAEQVAFPGVSTGILNINGSSGLQGAGVNLREVLCCNCCSRTELFVGFRYLDLDEDLNITEYILQGPNNPIGSPVGTLAIVNDRFTTRNQFYGPNIGAGYERRFGRFFLGATGQVALGVTHQTLTIQGSQVLTPPGGAPARFVGGLLTTPSNIGRFESDRFSVVPEVTLSAGYQLTPRLRVFGGYNFLYWTNVIRPGDQIDRVLDVTLVPNSIAGIPFTGQARPRVLFAQTDFWAQGLNLGLQYNW